jgi:glycosyltransferase involved in cell wall biosynthesis
MNVSVVIPTYKSSRFIGETLAGVFAQTQLPDELIVVDDCSPDDTVAVVKRTCTNSPVPLRMITLSKNSGGPAQPLNVGIEAATSATIATLDHDDTMHPERIQKQSALLAGASELGLCTGGVLAGDSECDNGAQEYRGIPASIKRMAISGGSRVYSVDAHRAVLEHGCYVRTCSTLMFPKEVWRDVGGFDEKVRTCIDLAFLAAITRRFDIGVIESAVATFRQSSTSLIATSRSHGLDADEIRAYSVLDRKLLGPDSARQFDRLMAKLHADWAHGCRDAGDYWDAVKGYLQSWRYKPGRTSALGMAKLLPHRILRMRSKKNNALRG